MGGVVDVFSGTASVAGAAVRSGLQTATIDCSDAVATFTAQYLPSTNRHFHSRFQKLGAKKLIDEIRGAHSGMRWHWHFSPECRTMSTLGKTIPFTFLSCFPSPLRIRFPSACHSCVCSSVVPFPTRPRVFFRLFAGRASGSRKASRYPSTVADRAVSKTPAVVDSHGCIEAMREVVPLILQTGDTVSIENGHESLLWAYVALLDPATGAP